MDKISQDSPAEKGVDISGDAAMECALATNVAGKKVRNLILFGLVMLTAVLLVHYSPLGQYVSRIENWKVLIDERGVEGHVMFTLLIIGLLALGMSRLALAGLAGVLLGFLEGFFVAQIGTVMGSWIAFSFARWGGRDWATRKAHRFPKLRRYLSNPTISGVFLARQLPLPALVQNAVLGMSEVRSSVFFIGTFLGYLPTNAAVTLMGSALGKEDPGKSIFQIITAVCLLGVVAVIFLRRSQKRHKTNTADPDGTA
jgi:uncharacterized membrane protein YdjX (TVP38/TMEM64 family)